MGLYSTIKTTVYCRKCDRLVEMAIQFEYGNLYSHQYGLGSSIIWGRTQIGDPREKRVVVLGLAGCPLCDTETQFDIMIDQGVVESVGLHLGKFVYSSETYLEIGPALLSETEQRK